VSHTYREIVSQPEAWERTLAGTASRWLGADDALGLTGSERFLFVGSGTSFYLAQAAAQVMQERTGRSAVAVPASEVFLSQASAVPPEEPLVAFVLSRSGSTSEAVLAARHLRECVPGARVVTLSCRADTELATHAHLAIELPYAAERSVVMTRSFTSMLLALGLVAATIAADAGALAELERLPGLAHAGMADAEAFGERLGRDMGLDAFVHLGLGPNFGLAQEATLKLKEMTQVPCEAYSPLEFRHGPISIVEPGTAAVLLGGTREEAYLPDLERDLARHGAHVAKVSPHGSETADTALLLPAGLSDLARGPLYLPPVQLLAYHRARAIGLNPDEPRNLDQVVVLGPLGGQVA
jgi:glucosamine--fructose-6-phosphate aminotransferase (isomerizing)